jgi:hypothetical protein
MQSGPRVVPTSATSLLEQECEAAWQRRLALSRQTSAHVNMTRAPCPFRVEHEAVWQHCLESSRGSTDISPSSPSPTRASTTPRRGAIQTFFNLLSLACLCLALQLAVGTTNQHSAGDTVITSITKVHHVQDIILESSRASPPTATGSAASTRISPGDVLDSIFNVLPHTIIIESPQASARAPPQVAPGNVLNVLPHTIIIESSRASPSTATGSTASTRISPQVASGDILNVLQHLQHLAGIELPRASPSVATGNTASPRASLPRIADIIAAPLHTDPWSPPSASPAPNVNLGAVIEPKVDVSMGIDLLSAIRCGTSTREVTTPPRAGARPPRVHPVHLGSPAPTHLPSESPTSSDSESPVSSDARHIFAPPHSRSLSPAASAGGNLSKLFLMGDPTTSSCGVSPAPTHLPSESPTGSDSESPMSGRLRFRRHVVPPQRWPPRHRGL